MVETGQNFPGGQGVIFDPTADGLAVLFGQLARRPASGLIRQARQPLLQPFAAANANRFTTQPLTLRHELNGVTLRE